MKNAARRRNSLCTELNPEAVAFNYIVTLFPFPFYSLLVPHLLPPPPPSLVLLDPPYHSSFLTYKSSGVWSCSEAIRVASGTIRSWKKNRRRAQQIRGLLGGR